MVGDVHCAHEALAAALAHLSKSELDHVLCVGDIPDGPGDINACCTLLDDQDVLCVAGNHERWLFAEEMRDLPNATPLVDLTDRSASFLRGLPKTRELETVAGRALLCHGLGESDMAKLEPEDQGYALENNDALNRLLAEGRYAFVINGHTHKRMVRRVGTLTVINANTLHRDYNPCCVVVDFERETAQFFDIANGAVTEAEARPLAAWTELF